LYYYSLKIITNGLKKACKYFKSENEVGKSELHKWAKVVIYNTNSLSTAGTVYDRPNSEYFRRYVNFIKGSTNDTSADIPDLFIPLNLPPIPRLIDDDKEADFSKCFEEAKNYILYAAAAYQRLRIDEELAHQSKLR